MSWCKGYKSPAAKRYQKRVSIAMFFYVVILCTWVPWGKVILTHGFPVYLFALLPAVPIIGILVIMGLYLQEEPDEYLRMILARSVIAATGSLLTIIVVNDFLRAFANSKPLPAFVCFAVFFIALIIAGGIQRLASRGGDDA